jgi:predicted branched-subunit amino acid permease
MMAAAAIQLVRPEWKRDRFRTIALAGAALVLSAVFHWTPVQVLACAAAAGFFWRPAA